MESSKIRGTLEGLREACRSMDRGITQILARQSGPQQDDLVELVYGLRVMHTTVSHLLTRYHGGAFPLVNLEARSAKALTVVGQAAAGFSLDTTVEHILRAIVDGIARPGSWERDVARRLFKLEAVLDAHRAINGS